MDPLRLEAISWHEQWQLTGKLVYYNALAALDSGIGSARNGLCGLAETFTGAANTPDVPACDPVPDCPAPESAAPRANAGAGVKDLGAVWALHDFNISVPERKDAARARLRLQLAPLRGLVSMPWLPGSAERDAVTDAVREERVNMALDFFCSPPCLRSMDGLRGFCMHAGAEIDSSVLMNDRKILIYLNYSPGARGVLEACEEFLLGKPSPYSGSYEEIFKALSSFAMHDSLRDSDLKRLVRLLIERTNVRAQCYRAMFETLRRTGTDLNVLSPESTKYSLTILEHFAAMDRSRMEVVEALMQAGIGSDRLSGDFHFIVTGNRQAPASLFPDEIFPNARLDHAQSDYAGKSFAKVFELLQAGVPVCLESLQARWLRDGLVALQQRYLARCSNEREKARWTTAEGMDTVLLDSVRRAITLMRYKAVLRTSRSARHSTADWALRDYIDFLYPCVVYLIRVLKEHHVPHKRQLRRDAMQYLLANCDAEDQPQARLALRSITRDLAAQQSLVRRGRRYVTSLVTACTAPASS